MRFIITITSSSSIQSSAHFLYLMLIADADSSLPSLSSSSSFYYNYHHHHAIIIITIIITIIIIIIIVIIIINPVWVKSVNIAESPGLTLSPMDIFGKIPQKTFSAIFLKRSQWNILIVSNLLVGSAKEFAALVSPMMYFFNLLNITN